MRFKRLFFVFPTLFLLACSPSSDELIIEDEADGDTAYRVNFRGNSRDWNPDEVSFNINSLDPDGSGVYRWIVRMQWSPSPEDHPSDVSFAFYSDRSIYDIDEPLHVALIFSGDFFRELDCKEDLEGCLHRGYGMISGTKPLPPERGAGLDDDLHSREGSLVIEDIVITKRANRTLEGHASGSFSLSGINTNASAPNPGTATGTFSFAPFEVLDIGD